MSPQCERAVAEVGNGISASLRGVDCLAGDMTQAAFGRMFGSGGALIPALTVLLTIYVAFFAFALITGRTRIGIRALMPRLVTLGLVLTFATSWLAYQSVVWNLATGAPDEIATVMTGSEGSATEVFADKIEIVFAAIEDATSQQGQPTPDQVTTFSPQGLLWIGATLLLLGTLGVLVTARIALAVLVAIGPVFVVMALFPTTRGLFTGWLKGLVMLAITPLFAVLGGTMMLELAVPVLNGLAPVPGKIDPRAAMAFFMIGAVHVALMMLVLKVSGTMVAHWRVFGLASERAREAGTSSSGPVAVTLPTLIARQFLPAAAPAASPAPRRIAVTGAQAIAANDATAAEPAGGREARIYASGGSRAAPLQPGISRARGIGSRFRALPARSMEKQK
jgi:type IV secretion system protein VirB6